MAAAGALLVLLLCLSSSGTDLGGVWKPHAWGPRLARADGDAFLAALPLKPLVTTPVELLQSTSTPVHVGGRQDLTVVFSRPVIALGADFGTSEPFAGKVPFNVTCATSAVPSGKSRWVTTTIARFDPDQDWPTDIDCAFLFNTDLSTYDGATLQLAKSASVRRLTSAPLFAYVGTVMSELASNATGGSWTPTLSWTTGTEGATYEVPADGVVVVNFNFPVNRTLLAASLQLAPNPDGLKLNISRCLSPWQGQTLTSLEEGAPDEACVSITFSGPLRDETKYQLVIPAGSRYSQLAGLTRKLLFLPLTGLRAFTLPIRQNFQMPSGPNDQLWDGTKYKRLVLWLPHGLANGTTADQLAQQITISRLTSSGQEKVDITSAKLVAPSHLQLQLDALQPHTKYRAAVAASDAIKDAFGKPLKASSGDFWSLDLTPFVAPPDGANPAAHFSPEAFPSAWPIATLGSDGESVRAGVWSVDASTDKGRSKIINVLNNVGLLLAEDVLGTPSAQVPLGNSSLPTQVSVPLDSTQDVQVVATCCRPSYYPTKRNVSATVQLVLKSSLLTSWVVVPGQQVAVWVTSSDPDSPGPVQGARAYLYWLDSQDNRNVAKTLGDCTTGPHGYCTVALPPASDSQSLQLVGLVRGPGGKGGVAYTQNMGYWGTSYPTFYTATLVLDRALVRPGETLHVTGYVAQRQPSSQGSSDAWPLGAPNITQALLQVTPSWFGNGSQVTLRVNVTESYGSLHASIPVPSTATAGSYSLFLYISPNDQLPDLNDTTTTTGGDGDVTGDNSPMDSTGSSSGSSGSAVATVRPGKGRRLHELHAGSGAGAGISATLHHLSPHHHHHHRRRGSHGGAASSSSRWLHAAPWRRALKQADISPPSGSGSSGSSGVDMSELLMITSETVTISDPRPPTADLTIKAAPWAKPNAAITVSLQATSYLGTQVSNATIKVVWQTDLTEGVVTATTDATGAATATIPLDQLPRVNVSAPGATLSLTAEWVGPTRERVVRTASVRLDVADRRLEISLPLITDTPGLPWGVQATLISNVDGSSIKGVPVTVALFPNITAGAECNTSAACVVLSGDVASGAACQLSLPCVGPFMLLACTNDTEPAACTNTTLGLNATGWQLSPLSGFDEPQLVPEKDKYSIGETATLWFQNAWSPDATALLLWGNQDTTKLKSRYLGQLPIGPVRVDVPLGAESKGGTGVTVLLSVPRGSGVLDPLPGLTISKLFDPLGAHTHALFITLNVAEPSPLAASIGVNATATASVNGDTLPVLAPGDTATVSVSVRDENGAPVQDAEVTLLAVDKALLDLLPYALKDLPPALALQLAALPTVARLDDTMVAPGALQLVYETLMRRLGLDPWLPADVTIVLPRDTVYSRMYPLPYLAAVDVSDEQYLDQFTTPLTYGPGKFTGFCGLAGACNAFGRNQENSPMFASDAGGAPSASPSVVSKGGANGKVDATSSSSARLTSAFLATPLFTVVRTGTDGNGLANFTAPQNLGTFIFRAFVVSKGVARLGSNETSVVVRRPLSLTASLPRIVRLGDTFLAGVLVTSPGLASNAPASTVTVSVKVLAPQGPVKLTSSLGTAQATLSGSSNQAEVRFNFTATGLGDASFEFTVTDASGASDGLVTSTPVLPQQSPVFVATSFALRGNGSVAEWQEGLALPDAAPGSGSLDLLAGVGYLPAILSSTNAIAKQRATLKIAAGNLDAYTSLALASVAPLLSVYSQTPSDAQLSNATDAIQNLVDLTQYDFGLLPSQPNTRSWTPTRADILLNLQASYLVTSLSYKLGGPLQAPWNYMRGYAVPQWQRAAAQQIVQDATTSRNPPAGNKPVPYQDYLSLAWARLALGVDWVVPECYTAEADAAGGVCTTDKNVRNDLSLASLVAAAPKASLEVYLITALALQASSSSSDKYATFVSQAADTIVSSVRVQGRTAYVAAYAGARDAAPLETQALSLRLLTALSRPEHASLVQKLAAYLAASGTTGTNALAGILPPTTPSAWVTILVASTLSKYDQQAGSTAPDLTLLATVDTAVVLKASFNKSTVGAAPATSSTPWDQLASPPGPLGFNVTGLGEVSVSVGLSFVPLKPLAFPSYRGIWVTSVIQLADPLTGLTTGPPLAQAPLGSVLVVTVQVTSPDDLGAVTVEALSPGGLEPLDPALTSGQGTAVSLTCPMALWAGDAFRTTWWWWWWPICPSQEVTPRAVTWRYSRLPAGTQVLTFSAVAATEGAFVLPAVKASADDQPEVQGMTAAGTFTVGAAGSSPLPVPGSENGSPAAKSCPKDCSGHGACNTGTGECVCSNGWTGQACDQPTAA